MVDITDVAIGVTSLIGDIAAPYVLIAPAGRSIGGIVPNVTIQETISDENTITAHPVQSGAPVSDHVFANPIVCDMLVGWSDSTGQYPGYVEDVYQMILALRDTRQPFDVYTGKRMLSSMLFGNITATTDETSENALMLRVRLQQVIISDTASSSGATSDNQAQPQQTGPETNQGAQATLPYAVTEGVDANVPLPPIRPQGIGVNNLGQGGIGSA